MLTLSSSTCRLGKIANNLEHHGDDDVTAFDVPVIVELSDKQLNNLVDDKQFAERVYESPGRGKPRIPVAGFNHLKSLELSDAFDEVIVQLIMGGKFELNFEDCRLSKIKLDLGMAANTECRFSIRLRPKTDKEILQLLHYQNREVEISTSGGKVSVDKRQQDLPLGGDESEEAGEGESTEKAASSKRKKDNGGETVVDFPGRDATAPPIN
jgi:hypothetical protein